MGDGAQRLAKAVEPRMDMADLVDQIDEIAVGGGELAARIIDDGARCDRLFPRILPGQRHAVAIARQLPGGTTDRLDHLRLLCDPVGQFADVGLQVERADAQVARQFGDLHDRFGDGSDVCCVSHHHDAIAP